MKDISEYIQSGIIEAYVLGIATLEEIKEVEELAIAHLPVRHAIDSFTEQIELQLRSEEIKPDPVIKPFLLATIDYMKRIENGEVLVPAPALDENSTLADYEYWLSRPDFALPVYFDGVYAKIIEHSSFATTAVAWIKDAAPEEVHSNEYEKFLIAEGTCDIVIEDEVHHLVAGDYLAIPLFKKHSLRVTSAIPCKAILQRQVA